MSIETVEYKGWHIEIEHDDDPQCPWTDWEGEPPIIAANLDGVLVRYALSNEPPELSKPEIRAHLEELSEFFDYQDFFHAVRCYGCTQNADDATELVNDAIRERMDELRVSEKLEVMAELYRWKGLVAITETVHGSVQGESRDLLLVATPSWLDDTGLQGMSAEDLTAQLKASAQLYADWAFGYVYGYTVPEMGTADGSACWGFYGLDNEKSGLLESARDAIDSAQALRDKPVCSKCGSDDVLADAYAKYDADTMQYSLTTTFDNWVCEPCGGECSVTWVNAYGRTEDNAA